MDHTPLRYTQNFLKNPRLVKTLIRSSSLGPDDTVFEIGPGKGIITEALATRVGHVIAVERDGRLARSLQHRFAARSNVTIIHRNALDVSLPAGPFKVFANIPFAHTADIVAKVTTGPHLPDDIYLVMQAEAANRFSGTPKGTLVAALLAPRFAASVVHHFRRSDFDPAPRVDVVMLRLTKRGPPLVGAADHELYCDFVTACFTAWAPTLMAALQRIVGSTRAHQMLRSTRIDASACPGDLSPECWIRLFHAVGQRHGWFRDAVRSTAKRVTVQQKRIHVSHRTRRPPPGWTSVLVTDALRPFPGKIEPFRQRRRVVRSLASARRQAG